MFSSLSSTTSTVFAIIFLPHRSGGFTHPTKPAVLFTKIGPIPFGNTKMVAESRGYPGPDLEAAEAIAFAALGFLADNPEELGRFLTQTGLGPSNLRAAASDPGFLAGVLDHMMADEPLLLIFAEQRRIAARAIVAAARRLRGAVDEAERPRFSAPPADQPT